MVEPVSVTIRFAVLADAKAIARVHVASWRAAYTGLMPEAVIVGFTLRWRESEWTDILVGGAPAEARTFVATGDRVLGFAQTGPSRDPDAGPTSAELCALYLDPAAWGLGVGRALFTAAVTDLRDRGRTHVTAWVFEGNVRARRFYEAVGMKVDGGFKVELVGGAELPHVRYALSLAAPVSPPSH